MNVMRGKKGLIAEMYPPAAAKELARELLESTLGN